MQGAVAQVQPGKGQWLGETVACLFPTHSPCPCDPSGHPDPACAWCPAPPPRMLHPGIPQPCHAPDTTVNPKTHPGPLHPSPSTPITCPPTLQTPQIFPQHPRFTPSLCIPVLPQAPVPQKPPWGRAPLPAAAPVALGFAALGLTEPGHDGAVLRQPRAEPAHLQRSRVTGSTCTAASCPSAASRDPRVPPNPGMTRTRA